MGAGVIPISIHNGELLFLFQKTFSGRKTGYLIDFGGGMDEGENYRAAAVREFVEESDTLYLEPELHLARRTEPRVSAQIEQVERLFEQTLSTHPQWWCRRAPGNPEKPKDWRTYFIKFPYRQLTPINQQWEQNHSERFKKRRELHWVSADQLLEIYAKNPNKLWKRVRQLEGAEALIHELQSNLL
ncbi:MAG: NUDIX hydrolase [Gammaproteobacteria bacterium]|jgi:8-oxo-dGTP pyrophosphatase MutT (NUDIX family)|nr:NUDIX hydrolase [Gammaproteobacteria bacterium]MBT3489840.1 NUDIX hydrolase [Gammaproteobacteria bacterium]MBT3718664.1 NUDIX hydrolase [Gammaproteobacteria bacterium]MBT3844736.1 NUDIX hydrolase [Gammaproteobacteria bacterium]MBT3893848.1 NUDIX hydrolase [Gammaproteobacteria bacterium]